MKTIASYRISMAIAATLLPIWQACTIAAPNYVLKDLGQQYRVDWVGNSFPATKIISNDDRKHVQQEIEDIFVKPDGTIYSNAVWDERFAQASVYRDGEQIAIMDKMRGNGVKGGYAVTAKGKYVYVATQMRGIGRVRLNKYGKPVYPDSNDTWYGVRLYQSQTGNMTSFTEGYGEDASFLLINKNGGNIQGLAIYQHYLYVSDTPNNQIKVYDLKDLTQKPILTWSVERPGKLAFDGGGQLWVVRYQSNLVSRFSREGKPRPQQIVLPQKAIAGDIAIAPQDKLLVTDIGEEQNIKIYENITTQPQLKTSLGNPGGIFAEPRGKFAPQRFYKPKGVGIDREGNIYVAQDAWSSVAGGGTIIQSYRPDGELRWQISSLEFMSGLDIDPKTEQCLYSKERVYRFDASKQPGNTTTYSATTLDPTKFPDDPRLHNHFTGVHLHYINDRPLLFMRDRNSRVVAMFRFEPETHDNIAIPYGMFSPVNGKSVLKQQSEREKPEPNRESIWLDANLNGQLEPNEAIVNRQNSGKSLPTTTDWFIESDGTIWTVAKTIIRQFPVVGLQKNYPLWDFANAREFPIPDPFVEVRRIIYDRKTDSMYVAGYTADAPYTGEWKAMGKKLARFSNWSSSPTLEWMIDTPWYYDNKSSREKPISIAMTGDYIFIGLGSTGKSKDLYQQSTVFVYDRDRGQYIGSMQHRGQVGPIMLDKATGLNVRKTANGEYLVFLEDAAFARSIIFHWKPEKKITSVN